MLASWKWGRASIPEGTRMVFEHLLEMQRIGEQVGTGGVPAGEDQAVEPAGDAGVAGVAGVAGGDST